MEDIPQVMFNLVETIIVNHRTWGSLVSNEPCVCRLDAHPPIFVPVLLLEFGINPSGTDMGMSGHK